MSSRFQTAIPEMAAKPQASESPRAGGAQAPGWDRAAEQIVQRPSAFPAAAARSLSLPGMKAPLLQRTQRAYGNRASQRVVMRAQASRRRNSASTGVSGVLQAESSMDSRSKTSSVATDLAYAAHRANYFSPGAYSLGAAQRYIQRLPAPDATRSSLTPHAADDMTDAELADQVSNVSAALEKTSPTSIEFNQLLQNRRMLEDALIDRELKKMPDSDFDQRPTTLSLVGKWSEIADDYDESFDALVARANRFKRAVINSALIRLKRNSQTLELWRRFINTQFTAVELQHQAYAQTASDFMRQAAEHGAAPIFSQWAGEKDPYKRWVYEQQINHGLTCTTGCHLMVQAGDPDSWMHDTFGKQLGHAGPAWQSPAHRLSVMAGAPELAAAGPADAVVRAAIEKIKPVLAPLGFYGYKIIPDDTMSLFANATPEELKAKINENIDSRQSDYALLQTLIKVGVLKYSDLGPILQDLLPMAAPDVRLAIQAEMDDGSVVAAVLEGLIELLLMILVPPTAIIFATQQAISGAKEFLTGYSFALSTGAYDVTSREQQEMAGELMFSGVVDVGMAAGTIVATAPEAARSLERALGKKVPLPTAVEGLPTALGEDLATAEKGIPTGSAEGQPVAQATTPDGLHNIGILEDGTIIRCSRICARLRAFFKELLEDPAFRSLDERLTEISQRARSKIPSVRDAAAKEAADLEPLLRRHAGEMLGQELGVNAKAAEALLEVYPMDRLARDPELLRRLSNRPPEVIENFGKAMRLSDPVGKEMIVEHLPRLSNENLARAVEDLSAFLERYPGRLQGDFASRYYRALQDDVLQAKAELALARDILDGYTPLGRVNSLEGVPESKIPNQQVPDYRVDLGKAGSEVAEVKLIGVEGTAPRAVSEEAIRRNLKKAISQVKEGGARSAFIRLDARQALPNALTEAQIEKAVVGQIKASDALGSVGWVEVVYMDADGRFGRILLRNVNGTMVRTKI